MTLCNMWVKDADGKHFYPWKLSRVIHSQWNDRDMRIFFAFFLKMEIAISNIVGINCHGAHFRSQKAAVVHFHHSDLQPEPGCSTRASSRGARWHVETSVRQKNSKQFQHRAEVTPWILIHLQVVHFCLERCQWLGSGVDCFLFSVWLFKVDPQTTLYTRQSS